MKKVIIFILTIFFSFMLCSKTYETEIDFISFPSRNVIKVIKSAKNEKIWGIGGISWFGGPKEKHKEKILPCFLYPKILVGDLNPKDLYCAIRFTKSERKRFKKAKVRIETLNNQGNICNAVDNVKIVDWGPGPKHRIIDVSPEIMKVLKVKTDMRVKVILVEEKK